MQHLNSQAIEHLRTALITAALTGEIDVSSIDINDKETA
jgi:hypothetical protein